MKTRRQRHSRKLRLASRRIRKETRRVRRVNKTRRGGDLRSFLGLTKNPLTAKPPAGATNTFTMQNNPMIVAKAQKEAAEKAQQELQRSAANLKKLGF